jgi:hypothetical protein
MVCHGPKWTGSMRQPHPRPGQVADRVQHRAQVNARPPAAGNGGWQQRPNDLPFLICQVGRTAATLKARLPCAMFLGPIQHIWARDRT